MPAVTVPVTVINLPPQPFRPIKAISEVAGIKGWWTPHEDDMRVTREGQIIVRPVVGQVPLSGGSAAPEFETLQQHNRQRRPSRNNGNGNRYWYAPIDLAETWNSYVFGLRADAGLTGTDAGSVVFPDGSAILIRPIISGNGATGGGISWWNGSTETNIITTTKPANAEPHFVTIAHNRATGQVKYALNDAPPVNSAQNLALVAAAVAELRLGKTVGTRGFWGQMLNLGHIHGDALTEPLSRQRLSQYRIALYGV